MVRPEPLDKDVDLSFLYDIDPFVTGRLRQPLVRSK